MRIFIGLREIANMAFSYSKGFKALGHETYSVLLKRNPYYLDSQYDVVIEDDLGKLSTDANIFNKVSYHVRLQIILFREFISSLRKCDVFIYIYSSSFLPMQLDYRLVKFLGKRIVSIFCGSDVRYWYAYIQEFKKMGLTADFPPIPVDHVRHDNDFYIQKIARVRMAERYSDLILSLPSFGQLQSRPYMRINLPVDLSVLEQKIPGRSVPIVLHAPSSPGKKGTDHVLKAVQQLKEAGISFEFKLIENLPNNELLRMLTESDIVIDQLYSYTIATLSLEAMANGNVVLTRYLSAYVGLPLDCPAVNVDASNLAGKLKEIIEDVNLRIEIAAEGRDYVETYHSHVHVAQQILDWLEPGGIQRYDFIPQFFKNEFRMPKDLLRQEQRLLWRERRQRLIRLFSSRLRRG